MEVFCFTFGCGSPLAKYYVMISAPNENAARAQMFCLFSRHWASCYRLLDFQRQIAEYGYQPLDVNHDAGIRLGTMHDAVPHEIYLQALTTQRPEPADADKDATYDI